MAVSEVRFMDGATESWELPAEMDSARVQLGSPPSGNRAAAFEVGRQWLVAMTNLSITADGDSKVQEADQICRSQERQQIASGDSKKCVIIHVTLADASLIHP
ncbi:unnamed protein product [Musa acuminata subsp. malaccensis]|uniref:(wild Malaysian banana) hypothetical protein n=1 Tax=Musa acuminata subsp. malaccensis TaxID=214687 RepID=A0A804IZD6_MUSAM|nr:unnamed protein product [Musa acuminata subsp. malaccensis]